MLLRDAVTGNVVNSIVRPEKLVNLHRQILDYQARGTICNDVRADACIESLGHHPKNVPSRTSAKIHFPHVQPSP